MNIQFLFASFEKAHPLVTLNINGHIWQYIQSGSGQPVILLPGFFGIAGTDFQYILAFEKHFQVISVSYPESISDIEILVLGIKKMMEMLNIPKAVIIGGSFSGFVAQYFYAKFPDSLLALVLTQTGKPTAKSTVYARVYSLITRIMPARLLYNIFLLVIRQYFPGNSPEEIFWKNYFNGILPNFTRNSLTNRFTLVENYFFVQSKLFSPTNILTLPILILYSSQDNFFSQKDIVWLKNLYPRANIQEIIGGHTRSVYDPAAQISAILDFLSSWLLK